MQGDSTTPKPDPDPAQVEILVDDLSGIDDDTLWARSMEAFPKLALWLLMHSRNLDQVFNQIDR